MPNQTGPRTAKGKSVSSQNSFKHGIHSELVVIDRIEDEDEWQGVLDGVMESLKPEGALEYLFVERIALTIWKMRRLERYQAVTARQRIDSTEQDLYDRGAFLEQVKAIRGQTKVKDGDKIVVPEQDPIIVGRIRISRIMPSKEGLETIMRYEAHLHRQLMQTLHELEAMQTKRNGGHSPLARLDILGAPLG